MQIPNALKRNSHLLVRAGGAVIVGLFVAGVAWTGTHRQQASHAYTFYSGHHSECVTNQPYVNGSPTWTVRVGQTFQATVTMYNNGSSTWSPSYGFYLGENNGAKTYWNTSGNTLNSSISPGQSKTFNLTLTAPSTAGTTPFNWAMWIVYQPALANGCTGSVTVQGPPGGFTLFSPSHNANSVALSWTVGSGATSYDLKRGTLLISRQTNGDFTDTGLSCGTAYSYVVTATNSIGSTNSNTISVTTNACPAASSPPATAPKTPTPAQSLQGSSNTATPSPADTTPPNKPDGFMASLDENTAAVALKWNASIDASGIKAYQLDRSTDQQNWQTLTSDSTDTSYLDTTPSFSTHYFYRVRATDNAGNASDFATTDLTTQAFAVNSRTDQDSIISDDSHNLSVTIPAGALAEAAQCAVVAEPTILPPSLKNYKAIDGPYKLICKNLTGAEISPTKPFSIAWTTSATARSGINTLAYFGYKDDWKPLKVKSRDQKNRTDQVAVEGASVFTAMGKLKHTPLLVKILLVVLVLAAVGALVFFGLVLRLRRQQQSRYDDYIHKEFGI